MGLSRCGRSADFIGSIQVTGYIRYFDEECGAVEEYATDWVFDEDVGGFAFQDSG